MATAQANSKAKQTKTAKEQISEAKKKMQAKIRSAKESYKEYKKNVTLAQKTGYNSGARDYNVLPKGKGVKASATKGYKKAFSDSAKRDSLNKKLKG